VRHCPHDVEDNMAMETLFDESRDLPDITQTSRRHWSGGIARYASTSTADSRTASRSKGDVSAPEQLRAGAV